MKNTLSLLILLTVSPLAFGTTSFDSVPSFTGSGCAESGGPATTYADYNQVWVQPDITYNHTDLAYIGADPRATPSFNLGNHAGSSSLKECTLVYAINPDLSTAPGAVDETILIDLSGNFTMPAGAQGYVKVSASWMADSTTGLQIAGTQPITSKSVFRCGYTGSDGTSAGCGLAQRGSPAEKNGPYTMQLRAALPFATTTPVMGKLFYLRVQTKWYIKAPTAGQNSSTSVSMIKGSIAPTASLP